MEYRSVVPELKLETEGVFELWWPHLEGQRLDNVAGAPFIGAIPFLLGGPFPFFPKWGRGATNWTPFVSRGDVAVSAHVYDGAG